MKREEKVLRQIKDIQKTAQKPEKKIFFLQTSDNCQNEAKANYVFPTLHSFKLAQYKALKQ